MHAALCAWHLTADHIRVVRALIAAGARVDASHLADFNAERTGGALDGEVLTLLQAALSTAS